MSDQDLLKRISDLEDRVNALEAVDPNPYKLTSDGRHVLTDNVSVPLSHSNLEGAVKLAHLVCDNRGIEIQIVYRGEIVELIKPSSMTIEEALQAIVDRVPELATAEVTDDGGLRFTLGDKPKAYNFIGYPDKPTQDYIDGIVTKLRNWIDGLMVK